MTQRLDLSDSLGFLLHNASRAVKRRFEARARELGLSVAQWRVLVALAVHGQLSQARLAEILEIEPISVSRLIERMEPLGWVSRSPDPQDRRVRLVAASAQGADAVLATRALADQIYAEALAGLPEGSRETLMALLKALISNLSDEMTNEHSCTKTE